MANPFTAKVKKPAASGPNPFAAKVKKSSVQTSNGKINPFAKRATDDRAKRIKELDERIKQADTAYAQALSKATKTGINKQQVDKLFDVADRHMKTLMGLSALRRSLDPHYVASNDDRNGSRKKPKKRRRRRRSSST